jgi:hypothetical protein
MKTSNFSISPKQELPFLSSMIIEILLLRLKFKKTLNIFLTISIFKQLHFHELHFLVRIYPQSIKLFGSILSNKNKQIFPLCFKEKIFCEN